MRLVEQCGTDRAPIVQLADRVAGWFVIAVLVLAAVTFALWQVWDRTRALDHAVALLIVSAFLLTAEPIKRNRAELLQGS